MTENGMRSALFVGGLCLDHTKESDFVPDATNAKHTATRQVRCPGGGAGNSSRCYRQQGLPATLIAPLGLDGIGDDIRKQFGSASIQLLARDVLETPISAVRVKGLNRFVERDPEPEYVNPNEFPKEDPGKFVRLHLDGKEPDVALHYAQAFRERHLQVSLDVNPGRANTDYLLNFVDIAFASEKFFEDMRCSIDELFGYFRHRGCRIGGVTMGERGVIWFADNERGETPAVPIAEELVQDTGGAGDGFQGAFLASLDLCGSSRSWQQHVVFASTVGAMMVQRFGNKHFPTLQEVEALLRPRLAVANR